MLTPRKASGDPPPAAIVAHALIMAALRAAQKPKARARLEAEFATAVRALELKASTVPIRAAGNPHSLARDYGVAAAVLRDMLSIPGEIVAFPDKRVGQ